MIRASYQGNRVLWIDYYREDTVPGEEAPWVYATVDMGTHILRGFFRQSDLELEAA